MRTQGNRARRWTEPEGGDALHFTGPLVRAMRVASVTALAAAVVVTPLAPFAPDAAQAAPGPATPIQHLVVILDTGASFDHYFGTYPNAANTDGTTFNAAPGTPAVNGLTASLLTANPNEFNPQRLTHSEALTCDQDSAYAPEQQAFDEGKMDKFVRATGESTCTGQPIEFGEPGLGMDYYDGNTATALWNYAQYYDMSDNNYQTTFGPETPAAVNTISADTAGGYAVNPTTGDPEADPVAFGPLDGTGTGALYGDVDPAYDDCSDSSFTSTAPLGVMTGTNIGDLLNDAGVTWGWFQGGFAPTGTNAGGYAVCGSSNENIAGATVQDYIPQLNPFQFYQSTANPKHLPPSTEAAIGTSDQANHNYDLSDFYTTLTQGNLPAVSFVSADAYQDGHPGYSDPIDEQDFLVNTVNDVVQSSYWPTTAIVITYLSSEGWYDHQASTIVNGSDDTVDTTMCQSAPVTLGTANDRCGYGPRVPLLVISPYAPANTVSHNITDNASITRFIEDNWLGGERLGAGSFDSVAGSLDAAGGLLNFTAPPHYNELVLNPGTGAVVSDNNPDVVPGQPTAVAATAGNTQATVTFSPPSSNGGPPVNSYTVTATDTTHPANGGQTATGPASPITVSGLTNGDTYTFNVTATNNVGTGSPSSPSNPVTPNLLVTLSFSGSLTDQYTSELVTKGSIAIRPSGGTVTSVSGTVTIAGLDGGSALVNVEIARLGGVYVGEVSVGDPGARLGAIAVLFSTALARTGPGGNEVSGTATGLYNRHPYKLAFTV
jgi:phospholipase C